MNISSITPPQVWTNSARSLTNIGSGALAIGGVNSTSLAASASVSLQTSAGIVGMYTIGVKTGAAATGAMLIQISDNTVNIIMAQTAASALAGTGFTCFVTNPRFINLTNNDGAVAGSYIYDSLLWTI